MVVTVTIKVTAAPRRYRRPGTMSPPIRGTPAARLHHKRMLRAGFSAGSTRPAQPEDISNETVVP